MKIFINAKTHAKKESVEKTGENEFTVCVKEPPRENKANAAIIEALAKHFGVGTSRVRIISGRTSRQKVFEIG